MRITSWNINSIRLRIKSVTAFLERSDTDILCLQEIKCSSDQFPKNAFRLAGYEHFAIKGQGDGRHGVAIVSRLPLDEIDMPHLCRENHSRAVGVLCEGVRVESLYVPAGGDVPDVKINPKFAHKLEFLARMNAHYAAYDGPPLVVTGDLNVAPHPNDVWGHKQLLDVVSHTPIETDTLYDIIDKGGFTDLARHEHGVDQRLYSWWSYRAKDWAKSNRGRRLDHIWTDHQATPMYKPSSYKIHLGWRGGFKPSDHAPISVDLQF